MIDWSKIRKGGVLILFLLLGITGFGADTPLLRAGILTDTHIEKKGKQCQKFRNALLFFKKQNVDLVIHTGDIANRYWPEGYRILRRYFNEIFTDKKPAELWVYAMHDAWVDTADRPLPIQPEWEKGMKRHLQIPNEPYDKLVLKGYPFLTFPQQVDCRKMEKMIQETIREYPGKPVFVLDHVPPERTTENSGDDTNGQRRKLLDKYPQVIHLSGHSHNSLRNERCIWQGNFTAVNCGGNYYWHGFQIANPAKIKYPNEVIIMEVFPDRILFRCYSMNDGREIRPDHPWCIRWPFDPAKAQYNPELRGKTSPKPYFEADARITMKADRSPFNKLTFTFPEAKHQERCYRYRFTLKRKNASGKWEMLSFKDSLAGFYLDRVPENFSTDYAAGFFEENGEYLLSVIPVNFYGGTGKPLELTFRSPAPQHGSRVFESRSPMTELPFLNGQTGTEKVEKSGGFYRFTSGEARLVFPEKLWEGKKGTCFRIIIDFAIEQPADSRWLTVLRRPESPSFVVALSTPQKTDRQRTVLEVTKKSDDDRFCFLIRDGYYNVSRLHPGKIAFEYVRIEKLTQDRGGK